MLNILYDITCWWHKHLWSQMSTFPLSMQLQTLDSEMTTHFFVPKLHLPAHITQCQTVSSFIPLPGVGHTDGEAPERGWANIN
ncbi:hypothetical protein PAXRUDRAFT_91183, partial [Paxillus rubicundulus Ve08.2h10]